MQRRRKAASEVEKFPLEYDKVLCNVENINGYRHLFANCINMRVASYWTIKLEIDHVSRIKLKYRMVSFSSVHYDMIGYLYIVQSLKAFNNKQKMHGRIRKYKKRVKVWEDLRRNLKHDNPRGHIP